MKNKYRYLKDIKIFHSSWLVMWASLGIVIGAYSSQFTVEFIGVEWVVVSACLLIVSFINKKYLAIGLALAAGTLFGLYRGGNQVASEQAYEQYIGAEVSVVGRVAEDPSYDVDGDLRMKLINVEVEGEPVKGELWLATSGGVAIKRSDVVTANGRLSEGFGILPAALYRARVQSIERQDYTDVARDTRDWFAGKIRDGVREPEASLGSGFLLGQKTALPEKLDQELRLLGLTHIVVASGYNLSILVRYGRRLLERVSRFTALDGSGFLVFAFANVTGFSPSMSRASLITGLSLIAWYFGRKFHPLVLLSFSAGLTVAINPVYAWGDIGWLLSFTSFIGVIMLSPLIHAYFWGDKKSGVLRQVTIETMSAQLLTLPLIVYVFGQYSVLALPANILILPLIPVAMLLTFIAGIGAVLLPFAAQQIAWPSETLLGYMTAVVDRLAQQPQAVSEIEINLSYLVVGYLFLTALIVYLWRRTGHKFRDYNIIE